MTPFTHNPLRALVTSHDTARNHRSKKSSQLSQKSTVTSHNTLWHCWLLQLVLSIVTSLVTSTQLRAPCEPHHTCIPHLSHMCHAPITHAACMQPRSTPTLGHSKSRLNFLVAILIFMHLDISWLHIPVFSINSLCILLFSNSDPAHIYYVILASQCWLHTV